MRKRVASYPAALAEGWARLGRWTRARFIASQLKDEDEKIWTLGKMADLAMQSDNLEEAISIARELHLTIPEPGSQERTAAAAVNAMIARNVADRGDLRPRLPGHLAPPVLEPDRR